MRLLCLAVVAAVALSAKSEPLTFFYSKDLSTFLEKGTQAKFNTDYSVDLLASNTNEGVIVCRQNCHLITNAEPLGTRDTPIGTLEWYVVLLKENAKEQLSTLDRSVTVHVFADPYAVVSLPDVRLLDAINGQAKWRHIVFRAQQTYGSNEQHELLTRDFSIPTNSTPDREVVRQIVELVQASSNKYMTILGQMTGEEPLPIDGRPLVRTRNTYAAQHKFAADYGAELLESWGYTVTEQMFRVGTTMTQNIIGRKLGKVDPTKVVVVGGHYDSTSQTAATLAPGAVDNGSGSVGALLIAEAFARFDFEYTLDFIMFGGEEQGLHGSTFYVRQIVADPVYECISALTMDMIGYSNRFYGVIIEGTTSPPIRELMNLVDRETRMWSPDLVIHQSTNSFGSDHVPFQRAGIPAILAIERDDTNYPHYHRNTDTIAHITVEQCIDIMKGVAAAGAVLAKPVTAMA